MAEFAEIRSILFVPGDRPERFGKAVDSGADAICIDLEDAVPVENKSQARRAILSFLKQKCTAGEILLRINSLSCREGQLDLALLKDARSFIAGVIIPKCEAASEINSAMRTFSSGQDSLPVIALIETARGLRLAHEVAAVEHVKALALGAVDLTNQLHAEYGASIIQPIRLQFRLACAEASVCAFDTPCLETKAADIIKQDAGIAAALGFTGKLAIHPAQVDIINAAFLPSESEIAWAKRVLDGVKGNSGGAFSVDGKMVDRPVIDSARRLLHRAHFSP